MKILIASDSYKNALSSQHVANAIEIGFKRVFDDFIYEKVPLADGGEGTIDSLKNVIKNYKEIEVDVLNPIEEKIKAKYILTDDNTAIIEMAKSTGIELVNESKRDVINSTSFGFGQQISDAIKNGSKKLILTIGSSATNDVGIGMLQALGVKFYNDKNEEISHQHILTAKDISQIDNFDISALRSLRDVKILIACDVENILYGKNGATYTFAKQKGAKSNEIEFLEQSIIKFSSVCERKLQKKIHNEKGSGAAGGVGFALQAFLNAKSRSGIETVIEFINLEEKIKESDLIITGEGRVDEQTVYGKTIMGVLNIAKKYNKPVIILAGALDKGYEKLYSYGATSIFDITPSNLPLEDLLLKTEKNLIATSYAIANTMSISLK
ncbi:glycerate kinase [Malaciobacter molluscorum LMG 25693]|uniref:Glycerate kinase n=1 Tax=Malaciobacter molluscorum LMG 25693 TaxID=870501 RepID=A0A2G1DHK6_9BACT|nr:glycerate kinase [Malaciobacter molluscorum]AXX93311.1 glycerate kinase 2 [Malaciobacter molluscorum LMG 25693]PHO17967.1 glycerate kinase [Malaciobacter molluscorum LMG 25693]